MRGVVLADTGPLFAMRDPDDELHDRAHEEIGRLGEERLTAVVPYPILLESYTLVMRKLGLAEARGYLGELEKKYPFVLANREDHERAAATVKNYQDQDITLVDAVLYWISCRLEVGVWTYDEDFDIMGADVWR